MSYEHGWAAINLDTPPRVPRTEYSVDSYHFELIREVTGIHVNPQSSDADKHRARQAFCKAWNYDFYFACLPYTTGEIVAEKRTSMGHAEYSANGDDMNRDVKCPFKTPQEVLSFDPWQEYGDRDRKKLVSMFEQDYAKNCRANPDGVSMTGIYCSLISGLIEIFGWEMMLTALGTDPAGFGEVANRYAEWNLQHFESLAEADVPIVMIHDDIVWTSGPFTSADWYRKYVFSNYKRLFAPILESGKKLTYCSDGDYTMFIDDIAACGVNGFVMEPMTDMAYIAEKYGKTHYFIGNADTRILLDGTKEDIRREVARCMDIGKKYPGFFMAVGNHIPANTPIENALYYNQCYEEMSVRN
jgi:hypothetical protein